MIKRCKTCFHMEKNKGDMPCKDCNNYEEWSDYKTIKCPTYDVYVEKLGYIQKPIICPTCKQYKSCEGSTYRYRGDK